MGLREAPEHLWSARIYGASQRITLFPRMIQANSFYSQGNKLLRDDLGCLYAAIYGSLVCKDFLLIK